jgi:glycine betaine/proline transport system permease protein
MTTLPVPRTATAPRVSRKAAALGVLVLWLVGFVLLRGRGTLALAEADVTPVHQSLNDLNDTVAANRNSNPLFLYFFNEIRLVVDTLARGVQALIAQPALDRPLPIIGWLGVVALATFAAWALGNLRVALLTAAGLLFIGTQGLWQEAMDTLALTITAVLLSLLVGIPLGIWAGVSRRMERLLTPMLDFMQTMPTFVYLAPLTLVFLIGPASATIATMVYAVPPVIRLTAHGIRAVPSDTLEAAESIGSTRTQLLRQVQLPMAKRTIVIGVNQTIMAALSMVTIAALIDAPGLGQTVVKSLATLDVGSSFNAGLAIVVLAIILDRATTAASLRVEQSRRRPSRLGHLRRLWLAIGAVVSLVCVYLSYTYLSAAEFPSQLDLGSPLRRGADAVSNWVQLNLGSTTGVIKDVFTNVVLNPLQALFTQSPWWLVAAVLVALAGIIGSLRSAVTAAICLALLVATGVWADAMVTLAATLVATLVVLALGLVVGVWMGRSARVDRVVRPFLDAAQTMPAFVYLVPFLALFSTSRFTAIIAAVVFAAPVSIKIMSDGISSVSHTTVEAARSAGSSTWQIITKVQLPMSLRTIALATNQGLIYVLSMIVVGGLVGAGALGYDVVQGFRQDRLFGKGLAAGLAVVLLGILLDRITQAAARRADVVTHAPS